MSKQILLLLVLFCKTAGAQKAAAPNMNEHNMKAYYAECIACSRYLQNAA
jgi:hypothetical protein